MDHAAEFEVVRAISIVRRDHGITQSAAIGMLASAAAAAAVPLSYIARLIIRSDELPAVSS